MSAGAVKNMVPREPLKRELPVREMQNLWLAMLRHNWSTLAVVPGDGSVSALEVATAIAQVGAGFRGRPIPVISTYDRDLAAIANLIADLQQTDRSAGEARGSPWPKQVIVALETVITNPLNVAVALACDVALLCVEMGQTSLADTSRTIELIGVEKFLGCATFSKR
jgi:hypothetical protein